MVHQFKLNGYNIVLDVFSGSVHVVDDVAYDIISMYKNKDINEIVEEISSKYSDISESDIYDCIDDIKELEENGKLYTEDQYADLAFDF